MQRRVGPGRTPRSLTAPAVLLAGLMAIGCRTTGGDRVPANDTAPAPSDAPSLASLADRIDPGPGPGVREGMPAWLGAVFGLTDAPPNPKDLASTLAQWRALPPNTPMNERTGLAAQIAALAMMTERGEPDAVREPTELAVLTEFYGTFDIPVMLDPDSLVVSAFAPIIQRVAVRSEDGAPDPARAEQMRVWLTAALSRIPHLHRHMAARMMREQPDSPQLPDVLDRLADASRGESAVAVDLRRRSIALRGRFATGAHHRALAAACYADLQLACGDAALERAKAAAGDGNAANDTGIAEVEADRVRAQKLLALANPKSVDEQLERARLLGELGRVAASLEAYAAIRKAHPADARALVGEVDARLTQNLDYEKAYRVLQSAPAELEHRDRHYDEMAIGVRSVNLIYGVLPQAMAGGGIGAALDTVLPQMEPVRRDVAALAAAGEAKGVVLVYLLGLGDALVPALRAMDVPAMMKKAHTLLPDVLALRRQEPESAHVYDLMLAAVQFSSDRKATLAAVAEAPPGTDAGLAMRAAMTRLALAVTFDDAPTLQAVTEQIEAWPESHGAAVRTRALARVDAVGWRMLGDAGRRDRAIARFDTVLASTVAPGDVQDLCSFVALLVDADRQSAAMEVLARAEALDPASELVRLQRAVLRPQPGLPALESLVQSSDPQITMAALAWLVAGDKGPGRRAKWVAETKAAARRPALRARSFPTKDGLGLGTSLNIAVSYSPVAGLGLVIDGEPTPRVFVSPR